MKRTLTMLFLLVLLVGCCGGPDLKPAMQEVDESLYIFELDLKAFWASDDFYKDRPEDEREDAKKIREEHWSNLRQTVKTALNPDNKSEGEKPADPAATDAVDVRATNDEAPSDGGEPK